MFPTRKGSRAVVGVGEEGQGLLGTGGRWGSRGGATGWSQHE